MVKSNELRVGNIVYGVSDRIEVIKEIHYKGGIWTQPIKMDFQSAGNCEDISGIPLTPEWLERFGFENSVVKLAGGGEIKFDDYKKGSIGFSPVGGNGGLWQIFFGTQYKGVFIKYVHQLQNLYFALTGEELEVKI